MGQPKRTQNLNWKEIQDYYDLGNSKLQTAIFFGISTTTLDRVAKKGFFKARTLSEATKISAKKYPRKLTKERKEHLRQVMLKRRNNGYNWTFAHSKDNKTKMSYPETFWSKVIENKFDDKNYEFNYPFNKFSLDFAWIHKKKVIEIDGEQHYNQIDQIERDKRKDSLLKDQGWELLRIRWKNICQDPKYWIMIANEFIAR